MTKKSMWGKLQKDIYLEYVVTFKLPGSNLEPRITTSFYSAKLCTVYRELLISKAVSNLISPSLLLIGPTGFLPQEMMLRHQRKINFFGRGGRVVTPSVPSSLLRTVFAVTHNIF